MQFAQQICLSAPMEWEDMNLEGGRSAASVWWPLRRWEIIYCDRPQGERAIKNEKALCPCTVNSVSKIDFNKKNVNKTQNRLKR